VTSVESLSTFMEMRLRQTCSMDEFDVVVVGAGAAGLAAALTLARALRSVVVLDGGDTRNAAADHSHGVLGQDGVSPAELSHQARSEVEHFGGTILRDEVTGAALHGDGNFTVTTASGRGVKCRQILVAGGVRDEIPAVPGVHELWGDHVVICPYCDGWEARGSSIAILGTGPKSIFQAHLLRQWSDRVTLFSNNVVPPSAEDSARLASRSINVIDGGVDAIRSRDGGVVVIVGESTYEHDIVFTAPRPIPDNRVLMALGANLIQNAAGIFPVIDDHGATTVTGLWAAGNAVNPSLKYSTALGAGMDTATHINETLVEADIDNSVRQPGSGIAT